MDDWLNLPSNMKGVFFYKDLTHMKQFYQQASISINA